MTLARGVGCLVGNISVVRGGVARGLIGVTVGQRGSGALVDLGQAGISDGRVGLGLRLGLGSGLGLAGLRDRLGLAKRSSVGDGSLLNLGN